jgi:hypothetical protein
MIKILTKNTRLFNGNIRHQSFFWLYGISKGKESRFLDVADF